MTLELNKDEIEFLIWALEYYVTQNDMNYELQKKLNQINQNDYISEGIECLKK